MDIIRGSLDGISRPASSEQTGSRASSVLFHHKEKVCPSSPFELVVLSNDPAANIQMQSSSSESTNKLLTTATFPSDQSHSETAEDDDKDSELQRAFEEMRRLDEILSAENSKEKEIRRQRKELRAKLWQELQKETNNSECAFEALNTKRFLALEAPTGIEEENIASLFETEIPDCEQDGDGLCFVQSFITSTTSLKDNQLEGSKGFKSENKQKDFIQRNIELVSGEVGQLCLTPAEKQRLADLLREIDEEEEEDSVEGPDREALCAASVLTDRGYTPEPSDLEQLIQIDSKICLLLPADELNSLQSSYTSFSKSQGLGSDVGWKCDRDRQPGEKVLQDIKERREQERQLQEIQQQLEILGLSQEVTNETPDLTEEQLLGLLNECELTESWISAHQRNEATSWDS